MLKFEIHAVDLGRRDWHRERAGWTCGRSWIRPVVNPVLESALDFSKSGTCLVTVRERDAEGDIRMGLTADSMSKWPGDHVTLEIAQDRVVVHAGVMGTAPLHIAARNGAFVGSWNLADLRPWFDSSSLHGPSVVRALLRNPAYASTTMFDGVHRVTERATATISSAGIQVAYPDPAEHVLAARDLADDIDAVAAFEKVLTYVVQRLPEPGGAAAVELSGGADSANVLLTAAERHQDLRTVGIEVSGRAGREQRHRRSTLAAHVGATDVAVHAGDHLPFDPAIRKQPHSPATAYYREALTRYRSEAAFDVLLSLGNTLAYLRTGEELSAACATFAANAAPGALVVVHTLVSPPAPSHGQQVVSVPGGQATVTIDNSWDNERQVATTNRAWAMPDGKEVTDTFERHVHGVGDLHTALTGAGLEVRDAFDHYDRQGEPVQGPTAYVIAQAPGVGDHR